MSTQFYDSFDLSDPKNPSCFDWRNHNGKNYVTPVKFQMRGDCISFAIIAAMESNALISKDTPITDGQSPIDLSESHLYDCFRIDPLGKNKWSMTGKLFDALRDYGVVNEFYGRCSDFEARKKEKKFTQISDYYVLSTDVRDDHHKVVKKVSEAEMHIIMKKWISTKGPVATSMITYDSLGDLKAGEVYNPTKAEKTNPGAHAVCIVGYDDSKKAWLVKNSWGASWADQGFGWIGYGVCTIDIAGHMIGFQGFERITLNEPTDLSIFSNGNEIALRTSNGAYVSARFDESKRPLRATVNEARSYETFEVVALGDNQIALKAKDGKYVSARKNEDNTPLRANGPEIRGWEKFTVVDLKNGNVALQTSEGKYVSANLGDEGASIRADKDRAGSWEAFYPINK